MASTSKAECTDAVETFEMHTDLAHRRESMYGYKAATYPVKSEHKKTWRIGGVHINYYDAGGARS
jgi:hypothetical protein